VFYAWSFFISSMFIIDVDENSKQPIIIVDAELTQKRKEHQRKGVQFMWHTNYGI